MNPTTNVPLQPGRTQWDDRWTGGVILITIGLMALVGQFFPNLVGLVFLALGLVFLVSGAASRTPGLIIPGGILSGLGAGLALLMGPLTGSTGEVQGGVFLIAFGAGFALITLVSAFFSPEVHWWALIPGGVIALVGVSLLAGEPGMQVLKWTGMLWPLFLIGIGIYLLIVRNRRIPR